MDDEEARLQRPLTDAEIEQILKKYGPPRTVAASYGSYRYLIGPEIFPSYLVAVKIVLWVLTPITLFMLLMSAVLAEENLAENLAETFWTMLSIGLFNLVAVTMVFAWLGRVRSGTPEEEWDLDELPEAVPGLPGSPQPVKRSEAVGSLAGLLLLMCCGWESTESWRSGSTGICHLRGPRCGRRSATSPLRCSPPALREN